jgi:hypothetical protein
MEKCGTNLLDLFLMIVNRNLLIPAASLKEVNMSHIIQHPLVKEPGKEFAEKMGAHKALFHSGTFSWQRLGTIAIKEQGEEFIDLLGKKNTSKKGEPVTY